MSDWSSSEIALSSNGKLSGCFVGSAMFGASDLSRFGPHDPMCSQIDADPGPPFHKNVTGRCSLGSASRVYAV
ncbi:hypothetical protein NW94_21405 [Burkholderia mallei]|nr:hypothetical protein NM78_20095 [Burkholderia mallei]ATD96135.1 hypothetical protein NW91_20705 [Burkholderia mallei]ATE00990.1 hypothetical protein NW92_21315 [Burkholderia mallei]ATE05912.1 hypothetical protein NW93_21615 [Burkholderia mallei]ATE10784.1 hypothetical protein NW94_21405 [Burkholderia mallei]